MHIVIDARAYRWTGIGTYIRNILYHFASMKAGDEFTVLVPVNGMDSFFDDVGVSPDSFRLHPVDPSYYSWQEQTIFLRQILRLRADLFHFTHFNVPLAFNRPFVVTVHDITRFIFPGQRSRGFFQQLAYEAVFSHAVQQAQGLISVSQTTTSELRQLPFRTPPVAQIPLGVSDMFLRPADVKQRQALRSFLDMRNPYVLYVGVWMGHKNIFRILEAFQFVKKRHPDMRLVITGKPVPGYMDVIRRTRELGLEEDVIFPGFVPFSLLPALYAESACFAFPSLQEGFGLPALEAAACGAPVVTSCVSSMPEVMGDAAEYVNPEYVPDIARGMLRVLEDASRKKELLQKGKSRASSFSWEECAKRHLRMYRKTSVDGR